MEPAAIPHPSPCEKFSLLLVHLTFILAPQSLEKECLLRYAASITRALCCFLNSHNSSFFGMHHHPHFVHCRLFASPCAPWLYLEGDLPCLHEWHQDFASSAYVPTFLFRRTNTHRFWQAMLLLLSPCSALSSVFSPPNS